jgi:formylglycine-generating enzyme required for sulfatase activity
MWGRGSVAGKIFISYRRAESVKDAMHLKTLLDKAFGTNRVFLDVSSMDGGANWPQTLERELAESDVMAVLIGKDWSNVRDKYGKRRLDDPHDKVRYEISQALMHRLPIMPVTLDGAAVPDAAELPGDIVALTDFQAKLLRTESFEQDADAIAKQLKVLLKKQQRGVPLWWVGLGGAVALAAGVAAGPVVLNGLGLPFPGVVFPGDAQLRSELAAAQNRLVIAESDAKEARQRAAEADRAAQAAQATQQTLAQRVATAERERDEARREVANASAAKAEAERAAKMAQAQQALSQRLAAAERERDEARKDVGNPTVVDSERKPASIPASVRTVRDCADCPEMVVVPAGKFMMGSVEGDPNESPIHEVTIRRSFAVGKFEVTFTEWAARVADGGCTNNKTPNDQGWGKGRRPVINVSWNDAKEYVTWLSRKTGQPYRLLTEAEWEYVARASTTTKYAFGDAINKQQAQFSDRKTAEVGSFPANAWGLHDMHGNVWEWVEDSWHGSYGGNPAMDGSVWQGGDTTLRVLRGGSWGDSPRILRPAFRNRELPSNRGNDVGFRVAKTL